MLNSLAAQNTSTAAAPSDNVEWPAAMDRRDVLMFCEKTAKNCVLCQVGVIDVNAGTRIA
jgi:hypothetical protein